MRKDDDPKYNSTSMTNTPRSSSMTLTPVVSVSAPLTSRSHPLLPLRSPTVRLPGGAPGAPGAPVSLSALHRELYQDHDDSYDCKDNDDDDDDYVDSNDYKDDDSI